jgi:hypothetical protein
MEMERSHYIITRKRDYLALISSRATASDNTAEEPLEQDTQRTVVSLTQGGFGLDVVDDERQIKERFLEYLFSIDDVDLPRTVEVFDRYFEIESAEYVDLDAEI